MTTPEHGGDEGGAEQQVSAFFAEADEVSVVRANVQSGRVVAL